MKQKSFQELVTIIEDELKNLERNEGYNFKNGNRKYAYIAIKITSKIKESNLKIVSPNRSKK
jgi:hypothetical protein